MSVTKFRSKIWIICSTILAAFLLFSVFLYFLNGKETKACDGELFYSVHSEDHVYEVSSSEVCSYDETAGIIGKYELKDGSSSRTEYWNGEQAGKYIKNGEVPYKTVRIKMASLASGVDHVGTYEKTFVVSDIGKTTSQIVDEHIVSFANQFKKDVSFTQKEILKGSNADKAVYRVNVYGQVEKNWFFLSGKYKTVLDSYGQQAPEDRIKGFIPYYEGQE